MRKSLMLAAGLVLFGTAAWAQAPSPPVPTSGDHVILAQYGEGWRHRDRDRWRDRDEWRGRERWRDRNRWRHDDWRWRRHWHHRRCWIRMTPWGPRRFCRGW